PQPENHESSRKKRVARGAGVEVQEINRVLKMHIQMAGMMKKMGKGKGGLLGKMMGMGGGAGMPSAEEMEKMQAELAQMDPDAVPPELKERASGKMPKMPAGLPGMGGGMPGLPGLGGKGGLPGLGGGGGFKGLPGFAKKKK
ncbi:MAG: signal recognition particle protein, partial [Anderseniella sp.]|nr:signal recognition particle protein [Anderseniella sp.]